MDYSANKIARNTSFFTFALILQKLISFAYFSYVAVKIGAGGLGSYSFALYFTTIFAVLIDIGLANVLVREVSKKPEESQSYLNSVMAIKIPLALFCYLLVVALINILPNPPLVRQLVYLSGIIMVVDSFTLTFYAFLRARQNLRYESLGTIIFQLIVFISGIIIVNLTRDLRWLIFAILLASVFNFVFSGWLVKAKAGLKFLQKTDWPLVKKLLLFTVPFALAAIFTRIYGYLDTVLLHQMIDPTAAGYYSLPYKITFSLQFIPMAFIASLYPAFAYYFVSAKETLARTFEKSLIYLSLIALPITLGLIALAEPLIIKIYTAEFLPSVLTLQILIASLPFLFLNFPLGSLLNACDRQSRNTAHIGIVMIVNAILNIVLIPPFSYLGAALASTISTLLMFGLQCYVAGKIVKINQSFVAKKMLAILAAGLAMFAALLYLRTSVNFILLIPIGAFVYGIVLIVLKGFSMEELKTFYDSLLKKPA